MSSFVACNTKTTHYVFFVLYKPLKVKYTFLNIKTHIRRRSEMDILNTFKVVIIINNIKTIYYLYGMLTQNYFKYV